MIKNLFILTLCLVFGNFVYADNWPFWRGRRGDGISAETGILKTWPEKGPKELWRVNLGKSYSGISVVDNFAYTAFGDDEYEYCIAVAADTGKEIWKKRIGYLFESNIGSGPRATPTIDGDNLYIIGGHGDLWCLDRKTGKKIWSMNVLVNFKAQNLKWGMCGSPVIYENMMLYNVGGKNNNSIVALDKATGKTIWTSANDLASYSTPAIAKIHGETQAVFFTGEGIIGVRLTDGKILWRFDWPVQKNAATPLCHDNYVFISSSYGQGAGALLQVKKNGENYSVEEVWKNARFKNHYTSSILWQGNLYGFHNHIMACIDFKTGEQKWTQRGFEKGLLVGIEGHAVIQGQQGNIALVELSPEKYISKGEAMPFAERTNCLIVPTIANGRLFISDGKEMICLDLKNK